MKIEAMIQLTTGDAIRGIVSRRAPWFNHLKVENATAVEGTTGRSAPADGILWVPKKNVVFVQQLFRTVTNAVSVPRPLTTENEEAPPNASVNARYQPV